MRLGRRRAALAAAVLASSNGHGARATTWHADDLASHFTTAPEVAPDQRQLVQVEVNGVSLGNHLIRVSNGKIALPPETLRALGITGDSGDLLDLLPESGITYRFDERQGQLSLVVPVAKLTSQRFAPDVSATQVTISPETWGAYVNYDMNLRHELGASTSTLSAGFGGTSGTRSEGIASVVM